MEKALFVTRVEDILTSLKEDKYDYLYFGNEFCANLLPHAEDLKTAIDLCNKFAVKLVLVTPYVGEFELEQLKHILGLIKETNQEIEIVFNDWGVYRYCKNLGLNRLILGRLLNKMERDMRIQCLKKTDPELYTSLRTPNILSSNAEEFLKAENIERIEFDNLFQGINLDQLTDKHKYSLYYPYIYLTTSRTCPCNHHNIGNLDKCEKNCYNQMFEYPVEDGSTLFYVHGRTLFLKNEKLDQSYESVFDRIIIQKNIPH